MNANRALATCLIASGIIVGGSISVALDNPPFVRIAPADVRWQELPGGHGIQTATLVGDPSKSGIYVIRVKFPPHLMSAPHWHPHDRYVTVLEGTWCTGTGDTLDVARAVPLRPGSFMFHPAKATHWDGSAGDGPVIVQIMGEGPGTTTPVDPKQPDWIEVRR